MVAVVRGVVCRLFTECGSRAESFVMDWAILVNKNLSALLIS